MFRTRRFLIAFGIFVFLNILLYVFMATSYQYVPFHSKAYFYESHHYIHDQRTQDGKFSLINALGVWDAQWYLRIAEARYPPTSVIDAHPEPEFMGGLTYAFFPFYPLILSIVDVLFHNIQLTAFIVTQLLLVANFFSLFYITTKLFSESLAMRATFLLFLFPFSIFYRSYFTESLFLLMLLWFSYFLIRHKWFYSTVLASLLFVTRPNGLFLGLVYLGTLFSALQKHKLAWPKAIAYPTLSMLPFLMWMYLNFHLTQNPLFWHKIQSVWFTSPSVFHTFARNVEHMTRVFSFPLHGTRESVIDVVIVLVVAVLIIWSRKFFKHFPQLWWISIMIWITPLLVKDLMSYSRYQVISFPIFLFLASKIQGVTFYIVAVLFYLLLLFTSIYFINWQWVG